MVSNRLIVLAHPTQPTITTLDSTDHPVWQINFPGVTVCPANKVVENKLAKVAEQQP